MQRKFNRDALRKKVGNIYLKSAWKRFQMNKYGTSYVNICKLKEVK